MKKRQSNAMFGYDSGIRKRNFVLPHHCQYWLNAQRLLPGQCEDGAGVKLLCSPGGYPIVKNVETLKEGEVCLILR